MCIDKLYDKIIRNSKELSMATNMISFKKCNKSPLTDEAFKEQLERVLRDNVLDTDIRITGDIVNGARQKKLGKYLEEENLAYRLNWVMQDYYKAGKDDEEREHRFKCYKLFWDALEDSEFFNRLESHKEELTKLQEKCKKFIEEQKEQRSANNVSIEEHIKGFKALCDDLSKPSIDSGRQKEQNPEDTIDEFTRNIRNLITDKLTIHKKGLDGSEVSSTVFIDDETAKDIASGILFYVEKEVMKNLNREIPEWSDNFEDAVADLIEKAKQGKCDSLSPIEEGNKLLAIAKHGKVNQKEWSEEDERILKGIIGLIDHDQHYGVSNKEMLDWLKSLRPQLQRRDTYYDIIHSILDMLKDRDFTQITPEHRVSLLNDIRVKCKIADECAEILDEPSWKPSKEQMEELNKVRTLNPGLDALYQQLKNM